MNASQLERFFLRRIDPENGDTKELPHAWLKYASGERLPRAPKGDRTSTVALTEEAFPGTAHWIRSDLWTLLKTPEMGTQKIAGLIRASHSDISQLFIDQDKQTETAASLDISWLDWQYLCRMPSLEAFGVMIAFYKLRRSHDDSAISSARIKNCRRWLHEAYRRFPSLRQHRDELVRVLQEFIPELGDLSYLGKEAPDRDWFAALFMSEVFGCDAEDDAYYWHDDWDH